MRTSAVTSSSRSRISAALAGETLELLTFQSPDAVRQLEDTGRLTPDPSRAFVDFSDAYGWMATQMNERLPTHGPTAVWLWASIRRRDLRLSTDRDDVEVRCRIPRDRVLLSSFQRWHFVLNRWYLPEELEPDAEEDDLSEADLESSWSRIFDIRDDIERRYAVQATTHYLEWSDVVSIRG